MRSPLGFTSSLVVITFLLAACGGSSSVSTAGTNSTPTTSQATAAAPPTSSAATTSPPTPTVVAPPTTAVTTTAAPPTTQARPANLDFPVLLMVDGLTVSSVGPDDDGTIVSKRVLIVPAPVRVAFMTSRLTIVTEEHPVLEDPFGSGVIVHYQRDGTRFAIPGVDKLFGIEVIGGEESVIASESPNVTTDSGDIIAVGLETGEVVRLGPAWGPEYEVGSVEWSETGIAVVSAWSDLTESVSYIDDSGNAVHRPSPTDDLPYASAPLVQAAALSPDGRLVVWAEGPDPMFDPDTGDMTMAGDSWVIKGMNLDTGKVEFAMPIDFSGVDEFDSYIESIHFIGRHIVVNRSRATGDSMINLAPVLIDMTGAEPATVPFDVAGKASSYRS